MRVRGHELTYPRAVFVAVLLVTLTTVGVGLGTSSAAYGSYNYDWDGTSDVRTVAAEAGADVEIVRSTTGYQRADAESTTAFILEPTATYAEPEADAVASFLDRGGTVVIAAEGDGEANELLADLDVGSRFDGRPLRDEQRYYRNPALPVGASVRDVPATRNVSEVTLNYGTAVTASDRGTALVNSSGFSHLDANANGELDPAEPIRERPIVVRERVGNGSVVLVSDGSVFINAMLDRTDNRRFAANLLGGTDTLLIDHQRRQAIPDAVAFVLTTTDSPLRLSLLGAAFVAAGGVAWRRVASDNEEEDSAPNDAERYTRAVLEKEIAERRPDWDDERVERVAGEFTPDEPGADG
jgi:hypothetical protein